MKLPLVFVVLISRVYMGCAQEPQQASFPNTTSESNELQDPKQLEHSSNVMFAEYWEIVLKESPETATALGDHRYDDHMDHYSLKCYEKKKVMMSEFLERANQLLSLAEEGSETQENLELFIANLESKLDHLMSGSYLFPVSSLWTPKMSLRYLLKYVKLSDEDQYWNLIARYKEVPRQIEEQIELMREGIRTNFTLNDRSLRSGSSETNQSVESSPFYKPFLNISIPMSKNGTEDMQESARDAITNHLLPAFQSLDDFMENEYRAHARPDIGVSSLPEGRDFYQHQLAFHLTDNKVTPEEIHRMGLQEVERISEEMDEVIHSLGLNMTPKEFSDHLRTDDSQFFETEEDALETYRDVIENVITPKLVQLFKIIPSKKLLVEAVPKDLASGPMAYYMRPSPDNATPGTFFLDATDLRSVPKYDVVTLAMHEGVPGHHFHYSYVMEREGLPEFRKYDMQSTAFSEGWALYAEYLGYELGLYNDPYMRYGHLSFEILRACRMVVDTGMHVLGWSRQQAVDFMMNHTASSQNSVEREVDRYITWPGQACAYKYGELKIKSMRKKAEEAMGSAFDIKEFHHILLRTNGPLPLASKQIDRYIATAQTDEGRGL